MFQTRASSFSKPGSPPRRLLPGDTEKSRDLCVVFSLAGQHDDLAPLRQAAGRQTARGLLLQPLQGFRRGRIRGGDAPLDTLSEEVSPEIDKCYTV